jgi:2-polyprenyl-6-methoxyphenol hydroxylase-like FAD-dependent oxidoreductase
MNQQKICIIGDGLAGLTTAAIMSKESINIDLYVGNKKKIKFSDTRTTAISESNYNYITNELNLNKSNFFWPCKKINLFFEDKKEIINFLNFSDKKKNLMHIFRNKDLKKKLEKIITIKKNVKIIKKNIESFNSEDGYIILGKKKIFYDLIILSTGGLSKLYSKIEAGRSIEKNYEEIAITSIIKHKASVQNASQFFLKEGPFAVLPFHKNYFSIVWSVNRDFFRTHEKKLKVILIQKLKLLLKTKNIKVVENIKSFSINLNLKTKYFKKNVVILGDGLHNVHPLAGQGFNLVLRDIKKISDLMSRTTRLGLLFKNSFLLRDFYNARKPENNLFGLGIDITNLFFKDNKYFNALKKKILININNFNFVKKISRSVADKGFLF